VILNDLIAGRFRISKSPCLLALKISPGQNLEGW